MVILAIVSVILAIGAAIGAAIAFADESYKVAIGCVVTAAVLVGVFVGAQCTRIVPTQHIGITRDAVSQVLSGPYPSGIASKPFFGSMYTFPASTRTERCEKFTPAIKGSYEILVTICFYFDTSSVN